MNVGLKKEVLDEIKALLLAGRCAELRELLERVSREYSALNGYFTPRFELAETVTVKPNPLALSNIARCLDKYGFEIRVEGEVYTVGQPLSPSEWPDEFFGSDIEMWVEGLTPEQLEDAVKMMNGKKRVCWVVNADRTLGADEFMRLLMKEDYEEGDCSEVLTLELVDGKALSLTDVSARFSGEIRVGSVVVRVFSDVDVSERYGNLWGPSRTEAILGIVRELWSTYMGLKPRIKLELRPEGW